MKRLQIFLLLLLVTSSLSAQEARTLTLSDPYALPLTLNGEPAFLPVERYQAMYFCQLSDTPLKLPPAPEDSAFFMTAGMLGVSWDKENSQYVVKQLKTFHTQSKDGSFSSRDTKRIFLLPETPLQDDWKALHLKSDAKAIGSDTERQTELYFDRIKQTGYVRNVLWRSANRSQKPFFDKAYPFRFVPVRLP